MSRPHERIVVIAAVAGMTLAIAMSQSARGGVIFGSDGNLGGGFRWDADPRIISGNERSLDGALRYSLQGGSYEAYRDLFSWSAVPSVADFTAAVEQAFAAWTSVDPVSGLGTTLSFVTDFATPVTGTGAFGGVDTDGAEIDLFGVDAGDTGTRGIAAFGAVGGDVTLTSGTMNYGGAEGGGAISGADVIINSNAGAIYSLDFFRRLLTHELGHSLGLGDVEDFAGNGFIDDDYDGTTSATALATLTNSWALLVDPLNPAASAGLTQFAAGTVANADPGLDTAGVDILMESEGLGISAGNPVTNPVPLTNDDYGTRQFLYPVPEPSALVLAACGLAAVWFGRRLRRR